MADQNEQAAEFVAETGKSHLKILVIGKTGVGKSALINALVGYEISPESQMEAGTFHVEGIEAELYGGIKVTFYDSPGLHDAKGQEKEYLQQIIDKCQDVDLVLFCSKLTDTRVTQEDCDTICEFTRVLGEDFWKNSVFVLTFANNVRPKTNIRDPEMKKKALKEKITLMSKKLREVLRSKAKVHSLIVKDIQFVPAGYYSPENQVLPDGSHWFSGFWAACFLRVKDAGKPAVINGCLDMFEIESEKSNQPPPQFYDPQNPYPMPKLSPPPYTFHDNYQALVPIQNRRRIPMGIRLPPGSPPDVFEVIRAAVSNFGLTGQIVSAFMGIGRAIIGKLLEDSDDED